MVFKFKTISVPRTKIMLCRVQLYKTCHAVSISAHLAHDAVNPRLLTQRSMLINKFTCTLCCTPFIVII